MGSRRNRILLLGLVYLLSFAGLGYLAWNGWSYYTAPLVLRARHSFYWALKPGGSVGYTLGVTGTLLMVVERGRMVCV